MLSQESAKELAKTRHATSPGDRGSAAIRYGHPTSSHQGLIRQEDTAMLKFWELAPSPNNTKVRMALRFKGIEFEVVSLGPTEREPVLEISGQEGAPMIEDKGIVLPDSEAILRYLDANYQDTPPLFPRDRVRRRACDAWKTTLDEKVGTPWLPIP